MKEIMKSIEGFITVSSAIFLLWILISWADVLMHNAPTSTGEPHDWNAFVLLTEIEP